MFESYISRAILVFSSQIFNFFTICFPHTSSQEYHDILWDIGYAKTWDEASSNLGNLYSERPPIEDFLEWRDLRVLDEAHWYGWFIDYWMEGGMYAFFRIIFNFISI